MMNPRRCATAAALTVVLVGWIVAQPASFGSAVIENTGAPPILDRPGSSLTADAEHADAPQATAMGKAAIDKAEMAGIAESATGTAIDATAGSEGRQSSNEAGSTDSSQRQPPETPPAQAATARTPFMMPKGAGKNASSIEIVDECLVVEICVDQYLRALYQRAPKDDTIKVKEQRKMTVKKKGKTRIVTQTFTRLVDEDFAWKDPKAAEKAGIWMMNYVIRGMDRSFKTKLFHALHAAAGLSPGITSAFRDDYRQRPLGAAA